MGPVSLGLGVAIGKAAFKAWFKDNEFASSITDSLSDTIGKVVPDWKSHSAANRQMQRISEKAAEALQSLIDVEWRTLEEGESAAAVFQTQDAVDKSRINSRAMAELEYDPHSLKQLIEKNLDRSMLSINAGLLAERLCDEAAQLIVDLSTSMPEFHREGLAEILRRESVIIDAVDKLFEELSQIRKEAQAQSGNADAISFEEAYRRAAIRRLDRIELFGLNSAGNRTSRQQNLSTAYISLSVTGSSVSNEIDEVKTSKKSDKKENTLNSIRAEEAAAISERVIIKGEAGSGKTTLLQSLAVRSANAGFSEDMSDWNALIPFFIPLRSLTGSNLPPPEEFPKTVAATIAGTMPVGWVHEQLRQGRGLLLVDGLDEISEQRREATRNWIEELLQEYPDCRVLVTSRPPAIPDGWLADQGFTEIELLPMSPDDVVTFIEHWHEAVAGEEQEQSKADEVRSLSAKLRERIRSDRALRELAASPLLCAMLCAMNRDRKQVLPSNRISLYEAATQLILHGRDEQRQVKVTDLPIIDFETKRDLLQDIAFWMMENGLSMADEWRIIDLVTSIIPRFPRLINGPTPELIIKSLVHRSGILRSPVEGKCDFVHNAFKEFLCARAVSDGDKFGFLENAVASSEAWREVAPMAAAITDDKRRTAFLQELLKRGDHSVSKRVMYHLLAVRCLETCTQLNPEIQADIKKRIAGLRPPQSIGEAKALSAAGDLAIGLLQKSYGQYARAAASCVRTLRLIGSQDALEVLESYGADVRGTVVKELLAAWPFFDRSEYARRVLSKSQGLWGGLRVDNLEGLEGVGYLSSLPRLSISSPRRELEEQHIHEIRRLKQLTSLTIRANGRINLNRLCELSKLNHLSVNVDRIDGFNYLSQISHLSNIMLSANDLGRVESCVLKNVVSLGLVGKLVAEKDALETSNKLATFSAINTGKDFDFSFLRNCNKLHNLGIPLSAMIEVRDEVPSWLHLGELSLYEMDMARNLDFLPDMPMLKKVVLRRCENLKNIGHLATMKNLQEIHISGRTTGLSLAPLEDCKGIQSLTLAVSDESLDLGPLTKLPNLSRVTAHPATLRRIRELSLNVSYRTAFPIASQRQ